MLNKLKMAKFSLQGQGHRLMGLESQDSLVFFRGNDAVLLAVSDGVSSEPDSKCGSVILTMALRTLVSCNLEQVGSQLWELARENRGKAAGLLVSWLDSELQQKLRGWQRELGADALSILSATVIAVIITESFTVAFGCGDGVILVNGKVFQVSSDLDRTPDLPAELLTKGGDTGRSELLGKLKLLGVWPTNEIHSIGVGTDGVAEVLPLNVSQVALGEGGDPISLNDFVRRSLAVTGNSPIPHDDASFIGVWFPSIGSDPAET